MSTSVLLLRSPSEDGGPDKYEEAFRARGYRPVSVPVLETVHKNLDTLAGVVKRGGRTAEEYAGGLYAGVIVTSGRACEAWRLVVQQLEEDRQQETGMSRDRPLCKDEASTPVQYLTGRPSRSTLSALRPPPPSLPSTMHSLPHPTLRKMFAAVRCRARRRSSHNSSSPTCPKDEASGCCTSRATRIGTRCREYWAKRGWS